ncbi:MAG: hypothetical protein K6G90_12090 [Clostridia bacterium]|nr:hypothetical protein [Clostridia bacterium]
MKKSLSILLTIALLAGIFSVAGFAADVDYAIANPYESVDWSWKQYRADLHSHTNASDGNNTLAEMTAAHYAAGFDIVAVTDHGISDRGWLEGEHHDLPALKVAVSIRGRGGSIEALKTEGETPDGASYTVVKANDTEYYSENGGREMMRVPFGIENNPSSLNNAHVCSWFAEYGDGRYGGTSDYITPIRNIQTLGGLSVINHPGEYTGARNEVYTSDAYNLKNIKYRYIVQKYAGLLINHDTCLGIDVNSKGDYRTRFDRKLWDILLSKVVPAGRNVYALGTSDAHSADVVYTGFTMIPMSGLAPDAMKSALANGAFFAASKNLGNYDELLEYETLLTANGATTEMTAFGAEIHDITEKIAAELKEKDQGSKYTAPGDIDAPYVNRVTVDDEEDTITLETTGGMVVRWIADGKTIATGGSIDLDDYSDEIGSYVRAEIFGKGGITYTQAFTLEYDGAPEPEGNGRYVDIWFLASIIPDSLVRLIAANPIWKLIWKLMQK